MANIRLTSPMSRFLFRPVLWDDEEETWPSMTMTEGLDVYEEPEKGQVVVKAAVPGIKSDEVNVTFEDGVLRISARSEEKEEEKKKNKVVYRKDRVVSFDYTTTLPRAVDPKSINAEVEDGVLTVTASIAEAAKPQKITVKSKSK